MRLALLKPGSMAEAVLTPRNKDLESGLWTRECTAHEHENTGKTDENGSTKTRARTLPLARWS
jgi:hypothetical protein